MGGGKRTLSSVFDWLSLRAFWVLTWRSLVMGKSGLEQGGEEEVAKSR